MRRGITALCVLAAVITVPNSEALAETESGGEFQVNTTESGHETDPSIAGLSDRGFVVTWTATPGQDGSWAGVFGRRYNARGKPTGEEFQVNTTTKEDQYDPSVAALTGGGFVVTWVSLHNDTTLADIFGQRFNAGGNPVGKEFRVNTRKPKNQNYPYVAGLAKGGFVVVWNSIARDGAFDVQGQRYTANGRRKGREFRVNQTRKSYQGLASVAGLSNGGFVVVWVSEGQDGDRTGVYGRRYNANGKAKGKEFRINKVTEGLQGSPSVAGLSNGDFVVAWDSEGVDGSKTGVVARRYSSKGRPKGRVFRVNSYKKLGQYDPVVAAIAKGGFVVTWVSYDQDDRNDPAVDLGGVYGQRFKATGRRKGREFRIPSVTAGVQRYPAVAGLAKSRGFAVTWESDGQEANGYNVYGRRYAK